MLSRQRQAVILVELRREGVVQVKDLVQRLGVSDMTIRRDLVALEVAGLVERVHGGAVARDGSADEPGFVAKVERQRAEKEAIATEAAKLVREGLSIGLSGGTTTYALSRHLEGIRDLTVVTNSLPVANELQRQDRPRDSVILTGGVRTPSDALVGPVANAAISLLHVDVLFMGVHGMDLEAGFTSPGLTEAETVRAFVARARQLVVLADHTKWQTIGLSSIVPLDAAHVLITDDQLGSEARMALSERVGSLVLVGLPRHLVP